MNQYNCGYVGSAQDVQVVVGACVRIPPFRRHDTILLGILRWTLILLLHDLPR